MNAPSRDSRNPHPMASSAANDIRNARRRPSLAQAATWIMTIGAVAWLLVWAATNPRFEWPVVAQYMFAPSILKGLGMSLAITAICMTLGTVLGVLLAVMKTSSFKPFFAAANGFIWFFRAVPMLVQLIFWFNLSYIVPRIVIGVPFGPELYSWDTNDIVTAFTAAIIGLTIHEGAYMAEIVRAGIASVDPGQRDAARSLGYGEPAAFMKFILPQALRVIIPPTGSQFISLFKGTSLVSVIGLTDLLHAVQTIYSSNFEVVPLLLVASIWYLMLIAILSVAQGKLEERLSRGYSRAGTRSGRIGTATAGKDAA